MAEDNSFEFTASSQPGNGYRQPPSGSCLSAGTQVVMAGGDLRAIEDVAPGDKVATPGGDRPVVLRSEPLRSGRTVYRFAGLDFGFLATQPFVILGGGEDRVGTYAAVHPDELARAVPSLTQFGLRRLAPNAPVLAAREPGGGVRPFPPPAVYVDGNAHGDRVYDIVVELGPDGRSEFFAGDGEVQLLLSSEIPRFLAAPETAAIVLDVLDHVAAPILEVLAPVPDEGFADLLSIGLDSTARDLMTRIGKELEPTADDRSTAAMPSGPSELSGAVNRLCAAVVADGAYDDRLAALVEQFVPRFAPQMQAIGMAHLPTGAVRGRDRARRHRLRAGALRPGQRRRRVRRRDPGLPRPCRRRRLPPVGVHVASSTDRSYYTSDGIAYFAEWRPALERPARGRGDRRQLDALSPAPRALHGEAGARSGHSGPAASPPKRIRSVLGPRPRRGGRSRGQVVLDARALGPDGMRRELEREAAWTPAQEPIVAARLARLASENLSTAFGSAVLAFHKSAATKEGVSAGGAMHAEASARASLIDVLRR